MSKEIILFKHIAKNKYYLYIQKYGFILLYVFWFLMEILINCSTPGQSVPHSVYIFIQRILKYSLIVYIVFFQHYSVRQLLIIFPVTLLLYYSARISHFHELFYTWLLIIGLKHTAFDLTVKVSVPMLGICIPVFALLCKVGIFPDAGVFRGDEFRSALGFIHPNSFGVRIFVFSACWYYIRRNKLSVYDYLFITVLAVFVWLVPNSRTSRICMIVMTILFILYSQDSFLSSPVHNIIDYILIVSAALINVLTVLCSIFYDKTNSLMLLFDKILSGRLSIANQLYKEFGVTLFGQQIYVNMSERIYAGLGTAAINFDNSYMRILLHWGIIIYMAVSVIVICGLIYEKRRNNPALFITLFMILIYSFSEKILYQGTYNIFILALSDLLYNKLNRKKDFISTQAV